MSHYKSFKDFRDEISLMAVAYELGYRVDKSKGRGAPSFVLTDQNRREIDRIYIFNPNDNSKSNFWRRNPGPGRSTAGDVVQFIKENITAFPENAGARNEVDAINRVCLRLSKSVVDMDIVMGKETMAYINRPIRAFNLQDFEREKGNWQKAMRFFIERGIDKHIAELFKDNYELVRDSKATNNVAWKNLGFPYRRPGQADIVGYEIRGFGKYKNKAEGTDSTHACWQAYLGKSGAPDRIPVGDIEYIHIAESAYDIMSYVQLNKHKLDLERSVFVSVGGTFTNELMHSLFRAYPHATPVFHFDNDIAGTMYDIRAASIFIGKQLRSTTAGDNVCFNLDGREFTVEADKLSYDQFIKASGLSAEARPKIRIEKAPGDFKDWNEILQSAAEAEKSQRSQNAQKKPYRFGAAAKPSTDLPPGPDPEDDKPLTFHR